MHKKRKNNLNESLIEAGRYKLQTRPRKHTKDVDCDLPEKEGTRHRHKRTSGYYYFTQGDNFSHLKRYLRKHIGRPWNMVYSEIMGQLRTDLEVAHVNVHLDQYVERYPTYDKKGRACYSSFGRQYLIGKEQFYVDRGGNLREGKG